MRGLEYGEIIFIDEVHSLPLQIEETFYSIMQDQKYLNQELPKFTLIGATTKAGLLDKPFRDRFTLEIELEPTTEENLIQILLDQENRIPSPTSFEEYHGQDRAKLLLQTHIYSLLKAEIKNVDPEVKKEIALRALGNPRVLKQLYQHVTAYFKVVPDPTLNDALDCFDLLGVDKYGLHYSDRRVIKALMDRGNKPVGLKALAGLSNVAPVDLEEMIEPRLVYCGFLERGPRGRTLTPKTLEVFDFDFK